MASLNEYTNRSNVTPKTARGLSPVWTYVYTMTAVAATAIPLVAIVLLILINLDEDGTITGTIVLISFWTGLALPALLLFHPRARVSGYSDKVSQIPVNHAGVLTWLGTVINRFYLIEGWPLIPWWLGFGISTSPVSRTIVQFHDEQGNPKEPEDRGHYTEEEGCGFVFMGERLIQEVVKVQADDLVEVTGDYNSSEQVVNPAVWQRASNPLGTIIGRQEATLRTGISFIHAEDVNGVRSLFPSMMEGDTIFLLKAKQDTGPFVKGDLVRTDSGKRMVQKVPKEASASKASELKKEYLERVNDNADSDCKPRKKDKDDNEVKDDFTLEDVQHLHIAEGLYEEIRRVGAMHVEESVSIKDFTLPKPVGDAAQKVAIERREQVAEVIQAETVDMVSRKHAASIETHGFNAVEVALAERGKATMVIGRGDGVIEKLIAGIKGKET